jgi:hypothetical protein
MAHTSPQTTVALVQLKAMLDDARRISRRPAPPSRTLAVILLHACNEYALSLAAGELCIPVNENTKFADLHSRVKEELDKAGGAWRPGGHWKDIRLLQAARNAAQHKGLPPDQQSLPGWLAATESYTRSLVNALYDTDIDQVVHGRAIENSELRAYLIAAERHLENGDPSAALDMTNHAFDTAGGLWRDQCGIKRRLEPPRLGFPDLDSAYTTIQAVAADAQDIAVDQTFAASHSDYMWYRQLRQGPLEATSLDEAVRALGFVFWWIVQWQAIADTFVPDRRARYERHIRQQRVGDGPGTIAEAKVEDRYAATSEWTIKLSIANAPADAQGYWERRVGELARQIDKVVNAFVEPTLDLRLTVQRDLDAGTLIRSVRHLLTRVYREQHSQRQAAQREAEDRDRKVAHYTDTIVSARGVLPDWIDDVFLRFDGNVPYLGITFVDSRVQPLFENLVRNTLHITAYYSPDVGGLRLQPIPGATELVALIQEIGRNLEPELRALRENERVAGVERRTLQAGLTNAIASSTDNQD